MGPDVQTNSLISAVYIHIPFCLTKCGYCSFFSVPYTKPLLEDYFSNLYRETEIFTQTYNLIPNTIYFGGGTPSLLSAEQINSITELLNPANNPEITLEVNPIQITKDWLIEISKTKVNRLSLGLQSMDNASLSLLGRKHTKESVPSRIKMCREFGFDNISVDLMYGLPNSTIEMVYRDIEEYLKLKTEHISTYLLSISDDALYKHWQAMLPGDNKSEQQYRTICEELSQAGFLQYELSNFAQQGYESRHNLHYWLGDHYLGLGAGASGFVNNNRYHRPDDINLWKKSISEHNLLLNTEPETLYQQKADFIIMQLRLLQGLDLEAYKARFGSDFGLDYKHVLQNFVKSGHLIMDDRYVRLSPQALFVSNSIFREFV